MIHLLFLDAADAFMSQLAAAFARQFTADHDRIVHVATTGRPGPADARVHRLLGEVETEIDPRALSPVDPSRLRFDLVIALGPAVPDRSALPGEPVLVRWQDLPEVPQGEAPDAWERLRDLRDRIRIHVHELFSGGYLATLAALKNNSEIVLDHFEDGVIAHDLQRRITWFNRAAERITGMDRRDVVGKLCPEIFSNGGLCGGRCAFKDGPPCCDNVQYPLKIRHADGSERLVAMSVVAMKNAQGQREGVLATMRDVTEVSNLRRQLRHQQSFHGIVGRDESMQKVYELITDLAGSDCPVLIQGESGTGKELVAGAIHGESPRVGRPFVAVNCGALPEGVLESELFGHVRGAFTGAVRDKKGRFSLADGGTIFLDEIGELTGAMQVKLLQVLQQGAFVPVGGEKTVTVDVRVVSATNRNLREMVRKGTFREDLFYRLCVVPVHLPPLRERRNDIPLLVEHFVRRFGENGVRAIGGVSQEAIDAMIDYPWPGNIRELQNAIQYAFVKCKGPLVEPGHLPPEILAYLEKHPPRVPVRRQGKLDERRVREALGATGGNKVQATQILGVGRATLYRFLRDLEKNSSPSPA